MSHHFLGGSIFRDLVGVNTQGDWHSSLPGIAINFLFSVWLLFNVISHCLSQFLSTRNKLVIHVMISLLMNLE